MAQYSDNNIFLKIDGVDVSAEFKEVEFDVTNSSHDTSMGANTNWSSKGPGLNDANMSITLGYDVITVPARIQHLAAGQIVEVEYGKEGAISGKPRHVQNFLIADCKIGDNVDKTPSMFELTLEGSGDPSINMFAGAVYA